jgi:hypothetical protein
VTNLNEGFGARTGQTLNFQKLTYQCIEFLFSEMLSALFDARMSYVVLNRFFNVSRSINIILQARTSLRFSDVRYLAAMKGI